MSLSVSLMSGSFVVRHERCALLHPQQRDLLGDQTEHENNHRRRKEEHRHVGETMFREVRVDVIGDTCKEKEHADRQEDTERRKQGCDLGDDQQEANAVGEQSDLTLSGAIERLNRHIFNR